MICYTSILLIGDIVLIKDDKLPRQSWKIGKVERLIISRDGKVRGAEVRTPSSNSLKRPISSLYPIEAAEFHNSNCNQEDMKDTSELQNSDVIVGQGKPKREAAELAKLKMKYL